jgi:hypothetical protein
MLIVALTGMFMTFIERIPTAVLFRYAL